VRETHVFLSVKNLFHEHQVFRGQELEVGLGISQFGRVSAHSATRPVRIGFGQFQPAINSKNSKPIGYFGRTGWVFLGDFSFSLFHTSKIQISNFLVFFVFFFIKN
jgi:hypothetical protein